MAETVHLVLKANGSDIQGESTQHSLGRENTIECLSWTQSVKTAREAGSAVATGRRQYDPITLVKRIDKSSPLLMKALTENAQLEAKFLFFRPNPAGDGTTEQYYTVEVKEARLSAVRQWTPNSLEPAAEAVPPLEEIQIVFGHIIWTNNATGVQHEDSWKAAK